MDPQDATKTVLGMTTILAYTLGEGGYTDSNGNGVFDAISGSVEPFVALPEAFRDDDFDGVLDTDAGAPVEFFADFDSNESYDSAPSTYQGVVCDDTALALGHCASLTHVRSQTRIIQSDSNIQMSFYESADGINFTPAAGLTLGTSGSFYVLLQDGNDNMPANGTSLAVSGDGYKITGSSGAVPDGSLGYLSEQISGNTGLPSFGYLYQVSYALDGVGLSIELTVLYP